MIIALVALSVGVSLVALLAWGGALYLAGRYALVQLGALPVAVILWVGSLLSCRALWALVSPVNRYGEAVMSTIRPVTVTCTALLTLLVLVALLVNYQVPMLTSHITWRGALLILVLLVGTGAVPALVAGHLKASQEDLVQGLLAHDARRVSRALRAGLDAQGEYPGLSGKTPLDFALESRDLELLRALVECPHPPPLRVVLNRTVQLQDKAMLEYVLGRAQGDDDVLQGALVTAIGSGQVALVRRLVDAGARLDREASFSRTPLMHAVAAGQSNVARTLLELGAPVNATVKGSDLWQGDTALELAVLSGRVDLVRMLLGSGADPNLSIEGHAHILHQAARLGQLEMLSLLVNRGADVNAIMQGGDTPLHIAARQGDPAVVRYLLEHGAGLDTANAEGRSPRQELQANTKPGMRELAEFTSRS